MSSNLTSSAMKLLSKLIIVFIANALALLASDYFVEGFTVSKELREFITIAVILSFANLILRPIVKLVLTPIIIITFGLFTFVINAGILYTVDIYFSEITIIGLSALIISTVIVGLVNGVLRFTAKIL